MIDEHLALERAIVDAINAELGAKRLSIKALAKQMDLAYDSTRNYLALERRLPLPFFLKVADELGTTPEALVAEARAKYFDERLKADA